MIIEAEDKADARRMMPPSTRADALIVHVRKYTYDEIRELHAAIQSGTAKPEDL